MAAKARDLNSGTGGDIGFKRVGAITGVVVIALAVQSTLLGKATLLGVVPQLVLVVVVSIAYIDGERVGVVTGFTGGLLQDLLLPQSIIGLTALVYILIGYAVGVIRQSSTKESVWTPVVAVGAASGAAEIGYASLAVLLGEPWVSFTYTLQVTGLVIVYNTLLTPFVFPAVRRVALQFRPERVYRW